MGILQVQLDGERAHGGTNDTIGTEYYEAFEDAFAT